MFQNIEELEKQVKEFQQNILASSEFIKGMRNLTNMVGIQQTEFDKESKEMLSAIEAYTQYVKEQTDLLINSITEQTAKEADNFAKSNEELITKVEASSKELASFVAEKVTDEVQELSKNNEELIAKVESSSKELTSFVDEKVTDEVQELSKNNKELITQVKTDSEELSSLITEKVDNLLKSNTDLAGKFTTVSEALVKSVTDQTTAKAREITDSHSDLVKGFESRLAEHENNLGLLLDGIKADNVKVSEETIAVFKGINQDYTKKLDDESALLRELISQLEGKYNQFIQKLENTNVDRLFVDLQKMKKSINSKLTLLFSGVCVAIILMIISFFIK